MKPLSGKELAKLVESKGWVLQRVHGSHHIYAKPGVNVRLSIPMHGSSKLKFGLQRHLMKLAGLPTDSYQIDSRRAYWVESAFR